MKTRTMTPALVLSMVCLAGFGCAGMKLQPPARAPENAAVKPETPGESPKGKERNYQIGDAVSVIRDDQVFKVDGRIDEIGENRQPAGYRVGTGEGRLSRHEWYPRSQIFPAPWAGNVNLKIGDAVYIKRFGNFEPYRGVVEKLPERRSGSFLVKFADYQKTELVDGKDIFSSIEPAQAEKLSPGDIVYFDKMHWAIVIGKRDDKIVIRRDGFPAEDTPVDVSRLQILK